MFSLVKFDSSELYIVPSKNVKTIQDANCIIKYKGAKYNGYIVKQAATRDELEGFKERRVEDLHSANVCKDSEILPNDTPQKSSTPGISALNERCTSTPAINSPPALKVQLQFDEEISTIDTEASPSAAESSTPSGASRLLEIVGHSWLQSSNENSTESKDGHNDLTGGNNNPDAVNNIIELNRTHTPILLGTTLLDDENLLGDPSVELNSEKKIPNNDDSLSQTDNIDKDENCVETNIEGNENDMSNTDNCEGEDTNRASRDLISENDNSNDIDYEPDGSDSNANMETLNSTRRQSIFTDPPNIDVRKLQVPVSKVGYKRTSKKYFCPFCNTLQAKFARHLELKHKNESNVARFVNLPKRSLERVKIIETIRNRGNYIHNTRKEFNTGIVITARQRQAKYNNCVQDYIYCRNCRKLLSKRTIRLHYKKCNKQHKQGIREITVMGRRLAGYIHDASNDVLRNIVFPIMRDDHISRSIKYDKLIILYGNKLCDKYTHAHQHDMIRAHLRLLGRFKVAIKNINADLDDLTSILRPQNFDAIIRAIRVVAHWDESVRWFRTPAVATTLTTLLKKCANKLRSECIKAQDDATKKDVKDFLALFEEEIPTLINKKAMEDLIKQKRLKSTILPSKNDIKLLYNYLKKNCLLCLIKLEKEFDVYSWKRLIEFTLILTQIFNRRRAGEIERLTKGDYENQDTLDKHMNEDLYKRLSNESREYVKDFVRITIRGKLGRTVPVLLNPLMVECIDTILKYRQDAGVNTNNEYIFSTPGDDASKKQYIRSCPLMRKFSLACGATIPSTLRGTTLRKHIATYTAVVGIEETQLDTLANFLGHHKEIHKRFYRMPVPVKEMTDVSRLLQSALGDNDDENEEADNDEDESDDDNDGCDANFASAEPNVIDNDIPLRNSMDDSNSSTDSEEENNPNNSKSRVSNNHSTNSSGVKRRSSSPFGKTKRLRWCPEERKAVLDYFGDLIDLPGLPSLKECQNVINENSVLRKRQPQQLKTWIDNQRRQVQRSKNYASKKY